MRILVIGSGGREHALVWKLAQSPRVEKLFVAPGNDGMSEVAEPIPIAADQVVDLAHFVSSSHVDLTVVGPEAPLVHGMADYFRERRLPIFGPTKAAARLEGSKAFAKEIMRRCRVPTAGFEVFQEYEPAAQYIDRCPEPVVVKADGLAGGKGAIVAPTRHEAKQALAGMLNERVFGEAGSQVVVEECLRGEEISVLAVVDGAHVALLEPSQDHKRIGDGDRGPNTGGMGAYSPVPMVSPRMLDRIRQQIFEPVVRGMAEQGAPFQGVLYAGLMLTTEGPKVLEFNVRFGDPETQALLPRLQSDLAELILAAVEGRLDRAPIQWDSRSAACVVLASQGYPGRYDLGREITGFSCAADLEDVLIFHAGTKREGDRWLTCGGRVLNVVGLGGSLPEALNRAYAAADRIRFEGKQLRRDIGAGALRYHPVPSSRSYNEGTST